MKVKTGSQVVAQFTDHSRLHGPATDLLVRFSGIRAGLLRNGGVLLPRMDDDFRLEQAKESLYDDVL